MTEPPRSKNQGRKSDGNTGTQHLVRAVDDEGEPVPAGHFQDAMAVEDVS